MTIGDKMREKLSNDEGLADFLLDECDCDGGCNPTDCPFYCEDDREDGCLSDADERHNNCRTALINHLKHDIS